MRLFLTILFSLLLSLKGFSQQDDEYDKYVKFNESFFKGLEARIKHNPEKAVKHFDACLQINDSVPAVHYYMALAFKESGQTEQAAYHIEQAVRLDPENKWYKKLKIELNNLPVVKYEVKEETETKFKSGKEIMKEVEKLKSGGNPASYYRQLKQLAEQYPFYPQLQYEAARAAFSTGKYKDAETFLLNGMDFALADKKLLRKYYAMLIQVYKALGNEKSASKYSGLLKKMK
jgi:Tfp pilus assembly protein PilF